ncbi:MAG: SH3 domain-containing protein [Planctomycetes bacterium]|nr:SH3 domain-containing protein [Planctomycetota bacterium]
MIGMMLLLAASTISADTAVLSRDDRFHRAVESYRAGLEARNDVEKAQPFFRQAAGAFAELWNDGVRNPLLARDMAQAYLLSGNLAEAIRAYHLGLRLAPHDRDLQAGLAFAREKVPYPATSKLAAACRPRERVSILKLHSSEEYQVIAFGIYFLGMLAAARAWMTRRRGTWIAAGLLLSLAGTLAIWVYREERLLENDYRSSLAIIADKGTSLRRGNGSEFPLRLNDKLPAGVEARILGDRGGWVHIELADGTVGWVDRKSIVELK